MKYLVFSTDYVNSCIKDEVEGALDISDLDLPTSLRRSIEEWNSKYKKFIPMDDEERLKNRDSMKLLDDEGFKLSKALSDAIPSGAKVKYYSEFEGKFRFL